MSTNTPNGGNFTGEAGGRDRISAQRPPDITIAADTAERICKALRLLGRIADDSGAPEAVQGCRELVHELQRKLDRAAAGVVLR